MVASHRFRFPKSFLLRYKIDPIDELPEFRKPMRSIQSNTSAPLLCFAIGTSS